MPQDRIPADDSTQSSWRPRWVGMGWDVKSLACGTCSAVAPEGTCPTMIIWSQSYFEEDDSELFDNLTPKNLSWFLSSMLLTCCVLLIRFLVVTSLVCFFRVEQVIKQVYLSYFGLITPITHLCNVFIDRFPQRTEASTVAAGTCSTCVWSAKSWAATEAPVCWDRNNKPSGALQRSQPWWLITSCIKAECCREEARCLYHPVTERSSAHAENRLLLSLTIIHSSFSCLLTVLYLYYGRRTSLHGLQWTLEWAMNSGFRWPLAGNGNTWEQICLMACLWMYENESTWLIRSAKGLQSILCFRLPSACCPKNLFL